MTRYPQTLLMLFVGLASTQLHILDDTTISEAAAHIEARDNASLATNSATPNDASHKLLVGSAGQIRGIDFDGTVFARRKIARVKEPGKAASCDLRRFPWA